MASLENRNGKFRIRFRYLGKPYARSIKTNSQQKAERACVQIERNIELISLGMMQMPDDCDVFDFLLTGKILSENMSSLLDETQLNQKKKRRKEVSIGKVFDLYFRAFLRESVEENSYATMQTHRANLSRILGVKTAAATFDIGLVQKYIDKRSKEPGRRGTVVAATIRKEITTLFSILQWAVAHGHVGQLPSKKTLRYPKAKQAPVFQTWNEIERKMTLGGLTEDEIAELWESLFLTTEQVSEVLAYVKLVARHEFIYPMFAFAAHTGARRSELLRSRIGDIDFESNMITIRELKRVKGMQSTRRVPMSPFLSRVLRQCMNVHPGGQYTFCMPKKIARSGKRRTVGVPISVDEVHDHFKRPLAESKWEVLNGWHLFRHSFCSNCAAAGIEQRVINEWVGHQTESIVRRYRHLFPNNQQLAIQSVFCN